MRTQRRRWLSMVLTVAPVFFPVSSPAIQTLPSGQELPQPALERVDPAVRHQLTLARQGVEASWAQGQDPAVFGQAVGDLGYLYLAYDLLEPAEVCLREAHELAPQDYRWPYLLGYLYQRRGQIDPAVEVLEASLRLNEGHAATLLRLAVLYRDRGDSTRARRSYEAALAVDEGCLAARHGLGELALRAGDAAGALEHLQGALAREPDSPQILYGLGLALRQLGRRQEAARYLRRVDLKSLRSGVWWGCPDPLITAFGELTRGSQPHLLRGAQAARGGASQLALAEYRRAVEANPKDPVARESLGSALYRQGDLEGAAAQYREAVRLDPGNPSFLHDLGQIRLKQGAMSEGEALLRSAVARNPALKAGHLKLAALYRDQGRFEEAISHYRKVLEIDPVRTDVRLQLAQTLVKGGRPAEAVEELGYLLDHDPPQDPGEHLSLATLVAQLGDLPRALHHFQDLADSAAPPPLRAQAHTRAGLVHTLQGRKAEALRSFRAALDLDPGLEEAQAGLTRAELLPDG